MHESRVELSVTKAGMADTRVGREKGKRICLLVVLCLCECVLCFVFVVKKARLCGDSDMIAIVIMQCGVDYVRTMVTSRSECVFCRRSVKLASEVWTADRGADHE